MRDEGYLAFVRTLPCCVCGRASPSEAAHVRMASPEHDKPYTGHREKPDDKWALPMCSPILGALPPEIGCHMRQHSGSERAYWDRVKLDPIAVALRLFARYTARRPAEPVERSGPRPPRKPKTRTKHAGRSADGRGWPKNHRKIGGRGFPNGRKLPKGRKFGQ